MAKVLVVYVSRTGNTQSIATHIAEGVRSVGAEVKVVEISAMKSESDFAGYDGYVFGSPTYHGEMMQAMKTMLFLAEKANLAGKAGGAFGAYGWSGEAPGRIYETMKNVFQMQMVPSALRQTKPTSSADAQIAQAYGREMGQKVKT
jgi:flavorubredoxin